MFTNKQVALISASILLGGMCASGKITSDSATMIKVTKQKADEFEQFLNKEL